MDSSLCNNTFALPPWIIFLVVFFILVAILYGKYRKFKEEMEDYRKRKNKRKDVEEEIEEVDLPDYNRFLAIEILLALLAFGTALLGFLASDNIAYSFTVNQTCIVSQLSETQEPTVTPDSTPFPTNTATTAHTATPLPTQTDTHTPVPPDTATITPLPTNTLTNTPVASPTLTLTPSSTPPGNLGPGSESVSEYYYWLAASINGGFWGLWEVDTTTGEMNSRNFGLQNNSSTTQMFQPALSPDGQRVAFTYGTTCTNAVGCNRDLYIGDVISNTAIQVTSSCGDEASPEWSPDGRLLAFHSHPIPGCNDALNGIILLDLSTDGLSEIVNGSYWNPTWSPDSRHMVFNGTNGIYGIEYSSCVSTQRCSPWLIWQGMADAPDWIDTNTIVFAARIESDFELYITDIVSRSLSTNLTQLTQNDFDDVHPTVPQTGRFVSWQAFPYGEGNIGTEVDENANLYIMDLQSASYFAQPLLVGNNINNFRDASLVRKQQ